MNDTVEVDGILGIPAWLDPEQRVRCAQMANDLRKDMSRLADQRFAGRLDLRCEGCAFRADTEANRTAKTILTAARCGENRASFRCHEVEVDMTTCAVPCRGFLAARRERLIEDCAWEVAELA